ncbi:MAG: hypothetical protein MUC66_02070 [Methanolinea sp.]|jgi:hypothetical protein|nr:hypothetical protein [Methanolinea sp.]
MHIGGLFLLILIGVGGAVLASGCIQQANPPQENPFPGIWVYYGKIGNYNATIVFTFHENMTGRYDMAVPEVTPPHASSMEFPWESEGDRLFIGSSSEQQHLDIRYYPDRDRLVVLADAESGIFVGDEFVTGPFTWEFFRVKNV